MNDTPTTTPSQDGGIIQKIKESPRTISALIIILIVAAAIYAFSGPEENQPSPAENQENLVANQETTPAPAAEESGTMTEGGKSTPAATGVSSPRAASPKPAASPETMTEKEEAKMEPLPESRKTDQGYEEVTQPGEGVTHLARRATSKWLAENNVNYQVSNEHRIYMEDYIKDRLGSRLLERGETMVISFDLVKEASEKAGQLSEGQLKSLSKYTHALQ